MKEWLTCVDWVRWRDREGYGQQLVASLGYTFMLSALFVRGQEYPGFAVAYAWLKSTYFDSAQSATTFDRSSGLVIVAGFE